MAIDKGAQLLLRQVCSRMSYPLHLALIPQYPSINLDVFHDHTANHFPNYILSGNHIPRTNAPICNAQISYLFPPTSTLIDAPHFLIPFCICLPSHWYFANIPIPHASINVCSFTCFRPFILCWKPWAMWAIECREADWTECLSIQRAVVPCQS